MPHPDRERNETLSSSWADDEVVADMSTEEGRRKAVLEAMGSFALEGMQPSAETVAWAREYIAGRLTTAQILEQLKQKYGVG